MSNQSKELAAFLKKMEEQEKAANQKKIKPIGTAKGDAKVTPIPPSNPMQEFLIKLLKGGK